LPIPLEPPATSTVFPAKSSASCMPASLPFCSLRCA
jgi:hypothetical protein